MIRILLLATVLLTTLHSLSQQFNFRNYTVKDGVAQSQIYSVMQDKRGYIWMGTRGGGITRFDGINFQTYTERDGLINNYIYTITEDNNGNLWIGTNTGLSSYNGREFRNFRIENPSRQLMVLAIAHDKKQQKWLATNQGVIVFRNGQFENITEKLGFDEWMINTVYADEHDHIWFGTGKGLYELYEQNGKYTIKDWGKVSKYMRNAITRIVKDTEGRIWIGTYGDGLYCYAKGRFFRIDHQQELYKTTILDIYTDNQQNLWLGTLSHGVIIYNFSLKSFNFLTERQGLSNNHVRSVIQDKSGSYWIGTSGGGISNYFGKQFTTYDESAGLGGNFIYSIFRDRADNLWIGNSQKGVTIWNTDGFHRYNASNGFQNVKVKAIQEGNDQKIYIGTEGQGVFEAERIITEDADSIAFKAIPGLRNLYVRSIRKDAGGILWITSAGNGIYKYSPSNGKIKHFTAQNGLSANRINALHIDRLNRIWYATESYGIGVIENDQPGRMITRRQGLVSDATRSLAEDAEGNLWIGTAGNGVSFFPLYEGSRIIQSITLKEGLSSANIYLMTFDAKDNLILGSETGLDYLFLNKERQVESIKHYSKGDGFTGVETCQNAVWNDKDGTIWFGTINGLSHYNPANLVRNNTEPITIITDVKLFYKSLQQTPYASFAGDWNQVSHIELPYHANHLSFDFFAVNFSNPDAVKYKWKLEGFDKFWSPPSREHSIVYSNINPGTYTFKVMACNEDGVWNLHPEIITIHIAAPFWQKAWFIILVSGVTVLLLFLAIKWQFNKIRKKAKETQRKLQLEKDMVELEQKTLRLQMNPHFIFNAMNSIQSNIGNGNEKEARYYLAKFSRLMRQILDNSRNTTISLEQETDTLENYLLIEKFCNGDRFDYEIKVDDKLEPDFIRIPPMLLQPFVENAIKHGMKGIEDLPKRGSIIVEFREQDNELYCSVADNGIGREKAREIIQNSSEYKHTSTAIEITKERLQLFNKDVAKQRLHIIDLYDENQQPAGTKVIIIIPLS